MRKLILIVVAGIVSATMASCDALTTNRYYKVRVISTGASMIVYSLEPINSKHMFTIGDSVSVTFYNQRIVVGEPDCIITGIKQ